MDTWTLQMGYPVVTVRQSGNQISATQQRFLYRSHVNFTEEFTSPYGLELGYFSVSPDTFSLSSGLFYRFLLLVIFQFCFIFC